MDQVPVPGTVLDADDEVPDRSAERAGQRREVVLHWPIERDRPRRGRSHDQLLHVPAGRGEQRAGRCGGDDAHRAILSPGAEPGSFQRVHGEVAGRSGPGSEDLPPVEHGGVVLLSLADHDPGPSG